MEGVQFAKRSIRTARYAVQLCVKDVKQDTSYKMTNVINAVKQGSKAAIHVILMVVLRANTDTFCKIKLAIIVLANSPLANYAILPTVNNAPPATLSIPRSKAVTNVQQFIRCFAKIAMLQFV